MKLVASGMEDSARKPVARHDRRGTLTSE